jgi:hypothetical protein
LRIEVGGDFIQKDHRRIEQESARQGNALRLAGAQPGAALADNRLVTQRQRLDELVRFSLAGGCSPVGRWATQANIRARCG